MPKLLTTNNPKTEKGEKAGYLTGILHLAPSTLSGFNVCPKASKGCSQACLNYQGRGRFDNVQRARINKTLWYFNDKAGFTAQLYKDIAALARKAARENLLPAVRINGTSDLPALAIKAAAAFPDIQFYDYTAIEKTFYRELPKNYHLTFSRKEDNDAAVTRILKAGFNVAAAFWPALPDHWQGYRVVDGDQSDLRFLDPENVIVGLKAKGSSKTDRSGFIIQSGATI